jgi:hypothetical protein
MYPYENEQYCVTKWTLQQLITMLRVYKVILLCALIASTANTCNCSATQVNDKALFLRRGNMLGSGFAPSWRQGSKDGNIQGNPKVISGDAI